jgi:asparagine synthase (glutamine-hydrolysing)
MQIEPAQYLIISGGNISKTSFWRLPEIDEENMLKDKKRVYSEFEFLLRDAIKIRMRSDVPYGAFLSGGLDSSSIVAIMSGLTSFPVNTFTIGYDKSDYDESRLASLVANKYRTKHFRGTVAPEQFETALNKVLYHYDGPFGDSSAIPTGQVSKFASKNVKMVLTGDGGDEVLSGYVSYQGIRLTQSYNKLPAFIQKELPVLLNFISGSLKGTSRFRLDKVAKASQQANLDFNSRMLEKIPMTSLRNVRELIPQSQSMIKLEDYLSNLMSSCTYKDEFYRLMFLDFKYTLPDDMLVKVDRMSMSESLEARIPFLDHRLVEYMSHVDKSVKMQGYERKSILRRTIGKELPPELLRAGKKGFGIPLIDWFRLPEFDQPLKKLVNSDNGLSRNTIIKLIDENNLRIRNNGNFIWMIFLYDRWINNSR